MVYLILRLGCFCLDLIMCWNCFVEVVRISKRNNLWKEKRWLWIIWLNDVWSLYEVNVYNENFLWVYIGG